MGKRDSQELEVVLHSFFIQLLPIYLFFTFNWEV